MILKKEIVKKKVIIKAIAITLIGAIVAGGLLNNSSVKSKASSSGDITVENVDIKENNDGTIETTVETSDGIKAVAIKKENTVNIYEYNLDGDLVNEANMSISDIKTDYTNTNINNDDYDFYDNYVTYNSETNSFDFIDKNVAKNELTNKEYTMVEEQLNYVNQHNPNLLIDQPTRSNTVTGTSGMNTPTLKWYGVQWQMSAEQVEQLVNVVKEASSLAGAAAGILAVIPACQHASAIAGVIAGVLYIGASAISLINKLGGNEGINVKFFYNGTFACTPI